MSAQQATAVRGHLLRPLGLELPPDERLANISDDKLRGGYYTPRAISAVLARWAIQRSDAQVLEPSCGDGQFVEAAAQHLGREGSMTGVELFPDEAAKAAARGGATCRIVSGDFFSWYLTAAPDARFDAVIGNPPFIRFQNFPEEYREAAFAVMRQEGLRPSRLTNAWVPFVVASTRALKVGGRLALVMPAELLQVGYAAELREYLVRKYRRLVIATFKQLLFSGIQQETILLFGIREDSTSARVKWIELDGVDDLGHIDRLSLNNGIAADLNHAREKWTQFYLQPSELSLVRGIEESQTLTTLGQLASVDVGVVTGRNEFFVLTPSDARERELTSWCVPMVGRSAQIPGLRLSKKQWAAHLSVDSKCLLLQLGRRRRDALSAAALAYVESGEQRGYHAGFKLRVRLPEWWYVPSVWTPDAFLLRQIHDGPRVVVNEAMATCTDTIHRVRVHPGVDPRWIAMASVTSLAFAFAEIRGRSYGGGVLELEPSEAEGLPFLPFRRPDGFADFDKMTRELRGEELLRKADLALLDPTGLTAADAEMLRGIWLKLYRRRLGRKPTKPGSIDPSGAGPDMNAVGGQAPRPTGS